MAQRNIGLFFHSAAAGNFGIGALTIGNLALAREAAARAGVQPRFTLFNPRDARPPYVAADDIDPRVRVITGRYMVSPGGFLADLARQDLILDISSGDSFTDIYPDKRFAYISATKLAALALGKPLVLSPMTIGPFSRQPHKAIASFICARAALACARDPMSMEALVAMAPAAPRVQSIDVAFAMPFTRPERAPGGPVRVGLNISGLLMSGGYAGINQYGLSVDYPALTHRLIEALRARADTDLVLVPHVIEPGMPRDDDLAAAHALQARYPGLAVYEPASPQDAKSFISGLDFLVGGRMHATIAAFSSGVPVVPISYSRKFEGLYGGLGYPWLVPATGFSTDQALAYILDCLERRAELAADIAASAPIVSAGLEAYVTALAEIFRNVAQR